MPIPGGGRYRVKTEPGGTKVRLHFTPGGTVNEAKSLTSGAVHTPAEFAADRKKKRMARGGVVPGRGRGDTVAAMLTPGEFVVRKSVVKEARPMLEALNRPSGKPVAATVRAKVKKKFPGIGKPRKMKKGGFVPFKKKPAMPMLPGDEMETRAKRAKEFETKNGETEF